MSWFRVDDKFAFHEKTVRAGNTPIGVWVRLGAWCSDHLTDGWLPGEIAIVIEGPDAGSLDRLCEVGLLERDGKNFRLHDFLDWNPSGKQVKRQRKELSETRSKAGGKGAKARWQTDGPSPSPDPIPIPEEKREDPPISPPERKPRPPRKPGTLPGVDLDPVDPDGSKPVEVVFALWLSGWQKTIGQGPKPVLTEARKQLIRRRLKDHGVEALKLAVRGIWLDDWRVEHRAGRLEDALKDAAAVETFGALEAERAGKVAREEAARNAPPAAQELRRSRPYDHIPAKDARGTLAALSGMMIGEGPGLQELRRRAAEEQAAEDAARLNGEGQAAHG